MDINPFNAAYNGDLFLLQRWYTTTKSPLTITNQSKKNATLLYTAASQGHVDIVRWLLQNGVDPSSPGHETGSTALHAAAFYGKLEVCKILLSKGARTDIENIYRETPLNCAKDKDVEIVKLLHDQLITPESLQLEGDPLIIPNHEHPVQLCKSLRNRNCTKCSSPFTETSSGYKCINHVQCDFNVCTICTINIYHEKLEKASSDLQNTTIDNEQLDSQLKQTTIELERKSSELEINTFKHQQLSSELSSVKIQLYEANLKNQKLLITNENQEKELAKFCEIKRKFEQFSQDINELIGFSLPVTIPILPMAMAIPMVPDGSERIEDDNYPSFRDNFEMGDRFEIPQNESQNRFSSQETLPNIVRSPLESERKNKRRNS